MIPDGSNSSSLRPLCLCGQILNHRITDAAEEKELVKGRSSIYRVPAVQGRFTPSIVHCIRVGSAATSGHVANRTSTLSKIRRMNHLGCRDGHGKNELVRA